MYENPAMTTKLGKPCGTKLWPHLWRAMRCWKRAAIVCLLRSSPTFLRVYHPRAWAWIFWVASCVCMQSGRVQNRAGWGKKVERSVTRQDAVNV